ncbi:hypothetical protein ACFE04_018510 [Oxalis oulophora]
MRFLVQNPNHRKLSMLLSTSFVSSMSSKYFLTKTIPTTLSSYSHTRKQLLYSSSKRLRPVFALKPTSGGANHHHSSIKTNGFASYPQFDSPPSTADNIGAELPVNLMLQLEKKLVDLGFEMDHFEAKQYNNLVCPTCNGGDSKEKSLSLRISEDGRSAEWICHRGKCGWKGGTSDVLSNKTVKITKPKTKREITEQSLQLEPLCDQCDYLLSLAHIFFPAIFDVTKPILIPFQLLAYLKARMISEETLRRARVMQKRCFNNERKSSWKKRKKMQSYLFLHSNIHKLATGRHFQIIVIAFTYHQKGKLVNCKYRDIRKKFWQEKDTDKIFYGLDDIEGESEIIIVEGEMDKLSMEEAGFLNCVSVPDGAPASVNPKDLPPQTQAANIHVLINVYLICLEVLMFKGPNALREVIENAELYPIRGLFNFEDFFDEIDAYYHGTLAYSFGVSTGWKSLNDLYNVVPGELTIVSGVPNSGKSEWIDALLCNLNERYGWKFALCSMENKVREHARKLLEKHVKKPFFNERYGESVERISLEEYEEGKCWLRDSFTLIRCEDDSLPSIKWVLDLAKAAVLRHGVRGLVIDPYNELDHQRRSNQTETEYVSQMLTLVKRFAQHHSCHVWFVAHPRQMHNWVGDPPNLYDISGSAHFINKCDNGIVIHRNRDPDAGPMDQVQVCVRKVRSKVAGTIGDAYLSYKRVTGEYMDMDVDVNQLKKKR